MAAWQWMVNQGVAIFVLVCVGVALKWIAPRIDRWFTTSVQTQEKLQAHMDKADERVKTQQAMCEDHRMVLERTDAKTDANLQLWKKACDILRHAAPEVLPNQKLVDEVQRKVDEMEQIAREA